MTRPDPSTATPPRKSTRSCRNLFDVERRSMRAHLETRQDVWLKRFQRSGDELRLRRGTYHVTRSLVVPVEYRLLGLDRRTIVPTL